MPNALPRELVVVMKPEVRLRVRPRKIESLAGADVSPLARAIDAVGGALRPLLDVSEDRLEKTHATLAEAGIHVPPLSHYYRAHAPDGQLDAMREALAALPLVSAAYVKPPASIGGGLNDMAPRTTPAPATTPDFGAHQT